LWLAAVCLGVCLVAPAGASAAPSSGACAKRVNDTPGRLLPCIKTDDLWAHLATFDQIAKDNLGADGQPSRNSGEPGYKASADYVAQKMREAGYDVHYQQYMFNYSSFVGTPTWSANGQDFTLVKDWSPGTSNGTANAPIQPANGIVDPPNPDGSTSTSGCTSGDFDAATMTGKIALIQRGGCNYGVKVLNAKAAGAVGVIIFNEGNPGRTAVVNGSLVDADNNPFVPDIPVAFTSYAIGKSLLDAFDNNTNPTSSLDIHVLTEERPDWNVIAESKSGDPNHVVVVDAHLDAIYGEGILDNASGSATILNVAEQMRRVQPHNKLRFVWFGGEELGLLGSDYYVNNLSNEDLSHIAYDLDADVTATPNYLIGVLDPAAPDLFGRTVTSTFPPNVYEPSKIARDYGVNYLDSIDKNHEFLSPVGTDAWWFNTAGVPASGVLTGQDCCKTQDEVDLFGGKTGNYEGNLTPPNDFDGGCVDNPFRWCDNLSNNDPQVMTFMSRTFDNMVIKMAQTDFTGGAASANRVARARAAMRTRAQRRHRPLVPRGKTAR
jgi:Zn-dependent M28 family amino/carboxypeptidase